SQEYICLRSWLGLFSRRIRSSYGSAALRRAATPPWTPSSPVVVHSCGVSDDPGGIRSSSGSAALRRAATPPWTPLLFSSRLPRQAQAGASWLGTQSAKLAAGG